jgi:glycosyltransferase involved in cell wall biosynthesis
MTSSPRGAAPAVTIITPTYNQERYLPQCIESVLGQNFQSWEQIVIDDGSPDATEKIVGGYTDPRIRYIKQDNIGIFRLAETYNKALLLARAPLIAILEGDDYWPKDKLTTLLPVFGDPGVVLAYGISKVIKDPNVPFVPTIPTPPFLKRFPRSVLFNTPVTSAVRGMMDPRGGTFTYPVSVILRKDALERIGGFLSVEGLPVTDYPTFLRLSLEGRFHYVDRVMGYWRYHHASTTVQMREAILQGVWNHNERFRATHACGLNLTDREWAQISARWRKELAWLDMRAGRRSLLDGNWSPARVHFAQAFRDGWLPSRFAALLGITASLLRRDIERGFRFGGRPWMRKNEDGDFEDVL